MSRLWSIRWGIGAMVVIMALAPACTELRAAPATAHEDSNDHDHEDDENHGNHEHEGHDDHELAVTVGLSEEEQAHVAMAWKTASTRSLAQTLTFPAEIRLNEDRMAHVVPRIPGVAVEVRAAVGDVVQEGDVLAVMESRDLADIVAERQAARARLSLAEKTHAREKDLWVKQISPEKDYLDAARELEEARIALSAAEQKLRILGVTAAGGGKGSDSSMTRFTLTAPISGMVVEKHITLGENLSGDIEAFVLADMSTVWVDVSVYQSYLPLIRPGQEIYLSGMSGDKETRGSVVFVAPYANPETRTVTARVVLPNEDGAWRPGLFVDVHARFPGDANAVVVERAAVQRIGDAHAVYVRDGAGVKQRTVRLGRESDGHVEILEGLEPGEEYVTEGAFEIKAKQTVSGMGSHAGHGH